MIEARRCFCFCTALFGFLLTASCEDSASKPTLGKPCDSSSECSSGEYCDSWLDDTPTVGMCTTDCSSSEACKETYGDVAFCIGAERCVMGCDTDQDCAADQFCDDLGKWCKRRYCDGGWQCWRYECNLTTNQCYTSCFDDSQCQMGYDCPTEYDIYECI